MREASFVGVPVVNVGDRQLGRERGRNVIDAPWEAERIAGALAKQIAHGRYPRDLLYGDGQSGARIAALVATAEITPFKRFQDAE
ncbi:MAG: UDP-N-acetylglucosamine 2-epimerase [Tsuneonella sp.]